jgi:undecaprenyl-diphosphatase
LDGAPVGDSAAVRWIKKNSSWLVFAIAFVVFVLPRISPFDGLNAHLSFVQRFSEWVLRELERLFKDYGYYVVFIGVLIENSMFLGLLVPGAIILILAGLSAENGSINLWYVLALAVTATIIGDTLSYFIGRLGWTKVLNRMGMAGMIEKVREPMESNSTWIILGYHLAGYSRVVGPAAAGIFRIPFRKWAPLDYAGGVIWVLLYTGLGVVLGLAGVEFGDTKRTVRLLEWIFLGLFAIGIVFAFARQARSGRDEGGPPGGGARRPATVIVPVEDRE